jgi:hypothetical protein
METRHEQTPIYDYSAVSLGLPVRLRESLCLFFRTKVESRIPLTWRYEGLRGILQHAR